MVDQIPEPETLPVVLFLLLIITMAMLFVFGVIGNHGRLPVVGQEDKPMRKFSMLRIVQKLGELLSRFRSRVFRAKG